MDNKVLPCDGLAGTLTDVIFFQPNNLDFNLVHTLRLEGGLSFALLGIDCFLGTCSPSNWMFLLAGWSEELSFLDGVLKVSASFLTFPGLDFLSVRVEVS